MTSVHERPSRLSIPLLLALAAYGLITLGFFAPALPHLATHYLGDGGDTLQFVWNAWWMDRTLLHGRNPWFCDVQLLPHGAPLVFHTLSELPMSAVALLGRAVGGILAFNIVILALYPFAGATMFLLARRLTGSALAAFPAGLAFMICPFMATKFVGHINLLCAGLLPLFALLLLDRLSDDRPRRSWGLALVLAAMLLSNIHTAVFAANLVAWAFVAEALRTRDWRGQLRRFATVMTPTIVVAGAYGLAVSACAIAYGLTPDHFGDAAYCPDLANFVLPSHVTSIWKSSADAFTHHPREYDNIELAVYLGWLVLPMAVLGWRSRRSDARVRLLMLFFVASLILALGPHVQWEREAPRILGVKLYLPMRLYRYIPVLGAVGQSGRFLIIGYMAIAAGVALAVAHFASTRGRAAGLAACVVAVALVALDYGFRPMWVNPPQVLIPHGEGRVLDPRLGNAAALHAQTIHERGLVGGYIARIPWGIRREYERDAGVGWLFQKARDRGDPPTRDALLASLHRLDVRHVCVTPESADDRLLRAFGFELVGVTERDAVFAVPAAR